MLPSVRLVEREIGRIDDVHPERFLDGDAFLRTADGAVPAAPRHGDVEARDRPVRTRVQSMSDPDQVYVRYLDTPIPLRLTRMDEWASPIGWTPDSRRFVGRGHSPALWSITAVGGEAEMLMPLPALGRSLDWATTTISPDGKSLAVLRTTDGLLEVGIMAR